MSFGDWITKNKKLLWIIVFVALLGGSTFIPLSIVPGPEGLLLDLYGVQFAQYSNTLWRLGEVANNQVLESLEVSENFYGIGNAYAKIEIKPSFPDPRNSIFRKDVTVRSSLGPISIGDNYYSTLQVERRRPTPEDITVHGDPLGKGDPTKVGYIEYHTPRIESGNNITFQKYCIHTVPVDFIIQMSVRGDKELSWSDIHLWFIMQTNVWQTAFTESQVTQIQEWLDQNPPENSTLSAYEYKGGFPIWAWIGEWDPLVWYDKQDRTDQPPQEALDNVRISPSLQGREVSLYTDASYNYDLTLKETNIVKDKDTLKSVLIGDIAALPDPNFATTVYTPIYLEYFGPYYEESGWGPWHSLSQWFPTVYMRIRVLYAIYGEFTYLWTKQEAEQYDYEWETRYSTYKYEEGPWVTFARGFTNWLTSPSTFVTFMMIAVVVIVAFYYLGKWKVRGL